MKKKYKFIYIKLVFIISNFVLIVFNIIPSYKQIKIKKKKKKIKNFYINNFANMGNSSKKGCIQ